MAIIFERFFVFEIHGCIECRKCRSIFLPRPDFPQNPFSTDFSRLKLYRNIKLSTQNNTDIRAIRASSKNYFPLEIEQDGGVLVICTGAIAEFEKKMEDVLIERQKAVSRIKASRNLSGQCYACIFLPMEC